MDFSLLPQIEWEQRASLFMEAVLFVTRKVPPPLASKLIGTSGNVLASASRDKDEVIDVVLDHKLRERYLYLFPLLHGRKPHLYKRILDKYEGPGKPDWLQKAQEEKTL